MTNGRRVIVWIGLALLATGCGANVYEQRFQNTQQLFARLALRNQHLNEATWTDNGGISIRVPRGFEEIAAPVPPVPVEGEPEPLPQHDNRQPPMLTVVLPGMRGAFVQGKSRFLYIISSREIKPPEGEASVIEQPGTDPTKFNADICRLLGDSAAFEIDYTKFGTTTFPQARVPFVLSKSFKAGNVAFPQALDDGRTFDWWIMIHFFEVEGEPGVQGAILVVEPKSEANSTFKASLDLALETFDLNVANFRSATGEAAASGPGL